MWGLCSLSGWDFSCHCGYRGHNWSLWWAAGTGPGANDPSFQCELLLLRFWFWWDTSADTAMEHILSQGLKCVFWTASTTLFWSSLKGREVKLYTNEFFWKSHPPPWLGEGASLWRQSLVRWLWGVWGVKCPMSVSPPAINHSHNTARLFYI